MANRRNPKRKGSDSSRDPGGFVAMPWSVLDSPAYADLSHPARSLLWEIARQYVRDNNGHLLCSLAYLSKRGWTSADVITRAKRELLSAGFIYETVMGHRPNKASWYAITWYTIDHLNGYDIGALEGFERSAYLRGIGLKNKKPKPSRGEETSLIAPSGGLGKLAAKPSHGAIDSVHPKFPRPSHGNHLDLPSIRGISGM